MNNVFYLMANNIFIKNWEEALANLKEYISINKNNKNVLLYALLLEELLKNSNLDFNFINTLNFFSSDNVEGYQMYYKLSYDSVLKKDYEQALKYLKEYKTYEKNHFKNNSLDIILLETLLEEVINKNVVINNPNENNTYYLFKKYFQKLQDDINSENYLKALNDCQMIKKYTVSNKILIYNIIENLLKMIIEMQKNKVILKKETMIYPNIEDYNFVLDLALKNGDYKTAYRNVGKVIYYKSTSDILKIYQQLLYKINLLNKKNLKEIEIKNNKQILDLIKAKDYKNLKRLLKRLVNSYDIEFYAFLLNIVIDIENENYLNFSKFIELFIKNENYKEICLALLNNISIKDNNENKEFDDMSLFNDILHTNSKIDLEIKLDNLKELLINKSNILELNQDEKNILNLIETYFNVKSNIDFDNYFAKVEKEKNIMNYFNKAMYYGDYSSVYQIMNSDEWFKNTDKVKNITYYSVIRKILIALNLKNNYKIVKNESDKVTIDNHYLDCLANLKRLIKKREFEEAYQFLCKNDFSYNETSKLYYEMLLKYLINLKRGETESLKC